MARGIHLLLSLLNKMGAKSQVNLILSRFSFTICVMSDSLLVFLIFCDIGRAAGLICRSQVAGRRSQVAGRRSRVAGHCFTNTESILNIHKS